jgi:hypothetical protein
MYRGIGPGNGFRAHAVRTTVRRRVEAGRLVGTPRKLIAMDDMHWFDTFHRKLVRDVDRRGLLRATASIAASLVCSAVPLAAAAKNRKQKGKGKGKGNNKGKGKNNGKENV